MVDLVLVDLVPIAEGRLEVDIVVYTDLHPLHLVAILLKLPLHERNADFELVIDTYHTSAAFGRHKDRDMVVGLHLS